jgi:NADPH-dependent 2,4-dienoyl-CoA reductase/sulfur reductase-like enzyme/peroxiredoxin family protein/rhodanese-related sulfurtransferase/TusA-related sulfurtransferase
MMDANKRIVIIGGVAGGASAAARARRLSEDAQIVMVERGEYISFANCGMPYYVGGVIREREKLLVQTPEGMQKRYRIDVRTRTEAVKIDRQAKTVLIRNLADGREETIAYDDLILSPGAMPIRPNVPGFDSKRVFTLRSIADMDAIKGQIDARSPERVLIIGGGYIGLEMTEAIRERDVDVTLVELANQVMGIVDSEMAEPIGQQLRLHGVDLRLGVSVSEIHEEEGKSLTAVLSDGSKVQCDMVVLSIGVKPEATLAKEAGLSIGELGGVVVDEHMRTSDPHIYAVGDAVEVEHFIAETPALIPLAGPANRQGRIAADNIFGKDSVYRRTQGTSICKVFDLAIGITGMSEKALKRAKKAYEKVYVHPASHAGYYPGASPLSLKLLFDPKDGKVLGAQAIGSDGVDKRIDVIAVAMRAGMTVHDLRDLELCYAPPYGSAKDPVNYAGFVASNAMLGDVKLYQAEEAKNLSENQVLLDVRTPEEVELGTIPEAMAIPIDELRDRLGELPKDKEIVAFCQVGLRGYLACRILSQKGYTCRNLTGGYKTYKMVTGMDKAQEKVEPKKKPENIWDDAGEGKEGIKGEGEKKEQGVRIVKDVDACGLQCPGPIMRLKKEIETIANGEAVTISTRDPGFVADVKAWCQSTCNTLASLEANKGVYKATVVRQGEKVSCETPRASNKKKTIIVFSDDFDRAMAAFVIANGAVAMGSEMTMFFTFWGINILRKETPGMVQKNWIERMFGWMMPRGANKLTLSKMNMVGMGTQMMKGIMRKKNVASLPELIANAKQVGVKMVVCSMSMDLMGIRKEELIEGVELGGVATYLEKADQSRVNLFI